MSSIHILGAGAIGLLHAHLSEERYLMGYTDPVLLLRPATFKLFIDGGRFVRLENAAHVPTEHGLVEKCSMNAEAIQENNKTPMDLLLVCTKAQNTKDAIQSIQPRIRSSTSVILLQNGVAGVRDELRTVLPPLDAGGPRVFMGSTTHGVWMRDRFSPVWAGQGQTIIGSPDCTEIPNSEAFDTLQRAGIKFVPWPVMNEQLIRKLVVNSCLNPLAALFGLPNGGFLGQRGVDLIMRLCEELAPLIDLMHIGYKPTVDELVNIVLHVADATKSNKNSMLADIESGRRTEIDYILGYWLAKARERGARADILAFLYQMMKLKEEVSVGAYSRVVSNNVK
ncbi:ketopantoate reductase PanE/ApbA C terminal-domain-containing protein [Powellomyces hirtus]|nr:ketopantoate reductase PanE/ApbA C terminal-domain-containing protein [Powellomyces hirtus]